MNEKDTKELHAEKSNKLSKVSFLCCVLFVDLLTSDTLQIT